MKILIATYLQYPHWNNGGVSTYVTQLLNGLKENGHSVDIIARVPNTKRYYLNNINNFICEEKLRVVLAQKSNPFINQLAKIDTTLKEIEINRSLVAAAAASFGLSQYDIIHAQDIYTGSGLSHVKPKTTPLVSIIHGTPMYYKLLNGSFSQQSTIWKFTLGYDANAAACSDMIITPSEWMRNFWVNTFKVPKEKTTVVPYGFDIENYFKNTTPPYSSDFSKLIFACPARLSHVKGHKYLLNSLARLKKEREDWICWIIGNGPLEHELKKQTRELGLDKHVVFLGYRKDVPSLLLKSDIVVLPSINDNLPFVLMEAQAAGKPIVTTNAGGIPELVKHKETGLLSPAGEVEGLYLNLKILLENQQLRTTLGEKGRKFALEKWSINRMIEDTVNIYKKLLKV